MDNIVRTWEDVELTEAELALTDVELEIVYGATGATYGSIIGDIFGFHGTFNTGTITGKNIAFDSSATDGGITGTIYGTSIEP